MLDEVCSVINEPNPGDVSDIHPDDLGPDRQAKLPTVASKRKITSTTFASQQVRHNTTAWVESRDQGHHPPP